VLRSRRLLALTLAGSLVAGGVMGVAGCPSTTTPATYVPQTGITISSLDLLGGLQCGMGPDQVYKYTAVVWRAVDAGPTGSPIFSNVWDCFTNGIFQNLPADPRGSTSFYIRVFGYSYEGTLTAEAIDGGPGAGYGVALWCPGGLGPNGSPCPLQQDAALAETLGSAAQWTTSCLASETEGAPVTAICQPFEDLRPDGSTSADGPAEGALEASLDASADGSAEASTEASVDATAPGDAAPLDAATEGSPSDASLDGD
jgi:hypothetical protein